MIALHLKAKDFHGSGHLNHWKQCCVVKRCCAVNSTGMNMLIFFTRLWIISSCLLFVMQISKLQKLSPSLHPWGRDGEPKVSAKLNQKKLQKSFFRSSKWIMITKIISVRGKRPKKWKRKKYLLSIFFISLRKIINFFFLSPSKLRRPIKGQKKITEAC